MSKSIERPNGLFLGVAGRVAAAGEMWLGTVFFTLWIFRLALGEAASPVVLAPGNPSKAPKR